MKKKIEEIRELIDELFSDRSVSASKTLDAMEEIRDECEFKIGALREDIKRKRK